MWQAFLLCFIPLLVAVDPFGILPVFASITADLDARRRRAIALRAVPTALVIGVVFFVLGRPLLDFLRIGVPDLQIAGGALLFVYALLDILATGKPAVHEEHSMGVVPLATPLIVGPAVLTLGLVLVDKHGHLPALAALVVNLLLLLVLMLGLDTILRVVPMNTMRAANKVVDVLLAAIGVSFVREGISAVLNP